MAEDAALYFRTLANAYTDTIRASDTKSNIVIVFVAVILAPVLAARDRFPPFLSTPIVLFPFLLAFLFLLISLYPRYPRTGRHIFPVAHNTRPLSFSFPENHDDEIENLRVFCATLSQILFWKSLFLQLSLALCLLMVLGAAFLTLILI